MRPRRLAAAALVCGVFVVVAAQRLAPLAGPPLYDGVIVEDPYKWLSPPPGYAGGAQSATTTVPAQGGQSPSLAVGTPEQPPQALVFAGVPVAPAAQPANGVIAGNVYRFTVTGQGGAAVSGQASGGVTIVLRGPANLPSATIERLSGGNWVGLQTDPTGAPHMFSAVVTDFGDFALIAPSGWTPLPPGAASVGPAGPVAPVSTAPVTPGGSTGSPAGSGPPLLLIAVLGLGIAGVIGIGVLVALHAKPAIRDRPARTPRPYRSPQPRKKRPPRRLR
jgi:hypothetical protein